LVEDLHDSISFDSINHPAENTPRKIYQLSFSRVAVALAGRGRELLMQEAGRHAGQTRLQAATKLVFATSGVKRVFARSNLPQR